MSEPRFDESSGDPATGERSPWWGVHVSRYLFAAPYVDGRRVLDVACGTGYGLSILEQRAQSVIGVDSDFGAVGKARFSGNGRHPVLVGDGCSLPFADSTFDVVTSFETLEHLEHRDLFVAEIGRVLSGDGVCILSTPNARYTQPVDGRPRNPFHIHEYTPAELTAELQAHFSSVDLLGQILNARIAISPFWDDQQRLPRTLGAQTSLLVWRTLNKLPFALRERFSQAVWGHPFTPRESDYEFARTSAETAPVLVAVCGRGPRG